MPRNKSEQLPRPPSPFPPKDAPQQELGPLIHERIFWNAGTINLFMKTPLGAVAGGRRIEAMRRFTAFDKANYKRRGFSLLNYYSRWWNNYLRAFNDAEKSKRA